MNHPSFGNGSKDFWSHKVRRLKSSEDRWGRFERTVLTERPGESLRAGAFERSRVWDQRADASVLTWVDAARIWDGVRWRLDKNWDRKTEHFKNLLQKCYPIKQFTCSQVLKKNNKKNGFSIWFFIEPKDWTRVGKVYLSLIEPILSRWAQPQNT